MMENKEMIQLIDLELLSENLRFLPMLESGEEDVVDNY
jgi:hypothetical protein